MSVKRQFLEVGLDKNNEWDFGVSSTVSDLSVEQMNGLRTMIVCMIGTAEDMFRRGIEARNPPARAERAESGKGESK